MRQISLLRFRVTLFDPGRHRFLVDIDSKLGDVVPSSFFPLVCRVQAYRVVQRWTSSNKYHTRHAAALIYFLISHFICAYDT